MTFRQTKLYLALGSHLKVYTDSFQFSPAEVCSMLPAHVRESQSVGSLEHSIVNGMHN